jgi:hypothetical protein
MWMAFTVSWPLPGLAGVCSFRMIEPWPPGGVSVVFGVGLTGIVRPGMDRLASDIDPVVFWPCVAVQVAETADAVMPSRPSGRAPVEGHPYHLGARRADGRVVNSTLSPESPAR